LYGAVPPVKEEEIDPLLPPLQLTAVDVNKTDNAAEGSVILTGAVCIQFLLSLT
jgi:hypothetical protein